MKMAAKRVVALFTGMALCICILSGCGQNGSGKEPAGGAESSSNRTEERVSILEGRAPYDLLTHTWQEAGELVSAAPGWNLTAYRENLLQPPEDLVSTHKYRTVDGTNYYILATYDNYLPQQEWEILYDLNRIDGDTLETEVCRLHLDALEDTDYWVISMDVTEGRPVLFLWKQDAESQGVESYLAVWFDVQGHVESTLDLMPLLQEAGLVHAGEGLLGDAAKWDSQGYYCVRGSGENEQYAIIDEEGRLVSVLDPGQGLEQPLVVLDKDSQGRCIWEASSAEDRRTVFWGLQEGKQARLYTGNYKITTSHIFNAYGDVYYIDGRGNLVRWDISTGACEILYMGDGGSFGDYYAALQDSSGAIVVFYDNGSRDYLFRIANEDVEQVELTLAYYGRAESAISMFVEEYNRTHPGTHVTVRGEDSRKSDTEWTRVQAELATGGGPDLLVTDLAHMKNLQEKGVLMELSEVLNQETKEALFSGILEYGRMDDGLYSICYNASGQTVIVSDEVWTEDTWTWEDVAALLEEQERTGQPYLAINNTLDSGNYLLRFFFLKDLEHCSLLDLEEKKAYFNTEEFCRLLELCRRYADPEGLDIDSEYGSAAASGRKAVKERKVLCYVPVNGTWFQSFSTDLADLGEGYHLVGYPTEAEGGNQLLCDEGIAINAATKYPELAIELVNFVLGQGCQELLFDPVRRDTYTGRIREHISYTREDSKPIVFLRDGKYSAEVDGKPDGTSYLPEYLDFMDSCRLQSGVTEPIKDIIMEEAEAFFAGDKDVRTVADIIQSRVQLYLDEND